MRRRNFAVVASTALVASVGLTGLTAASSGAAATNGRATITGTHSSAADTSRVESRVSDATAQSFQVALNPRSPAAVSALATAVSDPASPLFHHYLTAAQWEAQFSPTPATVARVTSWLASQGFTVGATSADRLSIDASGTAAQAEEAFGIVLNNYDVNGKSVQLAANDASVPDALAGIVGGVLGLDQSISTPDATPAKNSGGPQPGGFRNPQVCSQYYGQKTATGFPAYGSGYPASLPLDPCGYTPQQLQSAYGLTSDFAKGVTGKGETVAIVDAYASPTLLADAQTYYHLNDPAQALASSQFREILPSSYNHQTACIPSGWYGEQTLDVEAAHATAPGANLLYVGGQSCEDNALLSSIRTIVDGHLAQVITNSYGDDAGDVLDSAASRAAEDAVLQMAAATGITVQFSSGDSGDEFAGTGIVSPDYPASSPWSTAVGGTSLAVNANGSMAFQTGWSTSKSIFCTANYAALGGCTKPEIGTYLPPSPGGYDYGSGGGTSYNYAEPAYQKADVPAGLADRNSAITGEANRVVPDIAMEADPTTGMLIGETQVFPDGVYYAQYRIGGTSLASPLFAGIVALADQAAGTSLGFLNPVLYKADASGSATGFYDVTPKGELADGRVDYADGYNSGAGIVQSVRTLGYVGSETYMPPKGASETRNVALTITKGYDSMTGLGTPAAGFVGVLGKY
jgi:subtilase family serine protease